MFVSFNIVDMADGQAKDHLGYILASEVVAILPKRIDMNAAEREQTRTPHLLPRFLEATVVATRQGGQFVTREDIKDVIQRVEEAATGMVRVK